MKNLRRKLTHVRPSWRAIVLLWREEFSFRFQVFFGAVAVMLSFMLNVSKTEFLFVVLMIGTVFAVEALNTAIEELCDHVTPEEHPKIGKVKDFGSGASLLIGVTAIIIGLIIFIPHLMNL
jgi:diacylglycerol kinase